MLTGFMTNAPSGAAGSRLTIERLYRLRSLHRGTHPLHEAIDLWQLLMLSLSRPIAEDGRPRERRDTASAVDT